MIKYFAEGTRVRHEFLGLGTVSKYPIQEHRGLISVRWDNEPPIRYNMAENPCVVFLSELIEAEKGEK